MRVASRIAFIYPSTYQAMITSLATDLIYYYINNREEVYLERFYAKKLLGEEEYPRSIETRSPLKDFDLLISSLSYEFDIVNLISILEAGGIDPLREKRDKPLIAGGPVVISNPVPYRDLVDVFIIGEVEATIDKIIDLWVENRDNKKRFLEEAADLEYVYIPDLKEEAERRFVEDLNNSYYPTKQIENLLIEPVYGRGVKLEMSRGCLFWCSFCIESRLFQPYRERSFATLRNILEKSLENTISGKRVVIYSLLLPSSRDQIRFLEYLANENFKASIPSLRLDKLYYYRSDFLDIIKRLGQRTLTIAPETFSLKIQRIYMKYMFQEDLLIKYIEEFIKSGFDVKMYLIYGSKWEDMSDIKSNIEAIKRLHRFARNMGRRIVVSLNPLIPKARTIFQWIGLREPEELKKILDLYERELRGIIDTRPLDIMWGVAQAYISLSNRSLGEIFIEWSRRGRSINQLIKLLSSRLDPGLHKIVREGYRYGDELPWDKIVIGSNVEKIVENQYRALIELMSRSRISS